MTLEQDQAAIKTEAAKLDTEAHSVWAHYEIYIVAAVCLIIGAYIAHALKI